jgi:cytochrome c-type biogenesis protein CcmF
MPLIYKFTSAWGNHEGSMLLWVLILALFGALVATFATNVPPSLKATVLSVQAWIAASFYLFILVTSNPFQRLSPAPFEGRDLNPILQDLGLAIHPPLLYLGYVGFSIAFSFAVGALIEGRIDAAWARRVRPWLLVAWICLTCGIAMGSYWAYYELGWGGWWGWDPVENASLMPWLVGTALLHSAVVMEKREALKVWTILLAILTFSLSLMGTFLVRSGVLQSVHAFATDPWRGGFILAILIAFIGGSLTLFAVRAPVLRQGGLFAPVSREGALVLNNLLLTAACAVVLVGTLNPMLYTAITGGAMSIGPPYFNLLFGALFVALLTVVPFGSLLAWKRGDLLGVTERLAAAFVVALIGLAAAFVLEGKPLLAPFGVGIALFVIAGALTDLAERIGLLRSPLTVVLQRAVGLPRSSWGTVLAHLGLGITLLGIVGETQWGQERIAAVSPGDKVQVRNYDITFDRSFSRRGPNYSELATIFTVRRHGDIVGVLEPSKRAFSARGMTTTESALMARGVSQLYLSLGEIHDNGSVDIRLYYKPLVLLIWIGCIVMAIGGAFSLSDRRLRVGVPKPARAKAKAVLAPAE